MMNEFEKDRALKATAQMYTNITFMVSRLYLELSQFEANHLNPTDWDIRFSGVRAVHTVKEYIEEELTKILELMGIDSKDFIEKVYHITPDSRLTKCAPIPYQAKEEIENLLANPAFKDKKAKDLARNYLGIDTEQATNPENTESAHTGLDTGQGKLPNDLKDEWESALKEIQTYLEENKEDDGE